MLDKQIRLFSVDTSNFYYADERELHNKNKEARMERKRLINGYNESTENGTVHHLGTKEILNKLSKYGYTEKQVNVICNEDSFESIKNQEVLELLCLYKPIVSKIKELSVIAKETKNKLLCLLSERVNEKPRNLVEESLLNKNGEILRDNIVSVFESTFTRIIGAKEDSLITDIMIVQVYYFDIAQAIILNGFYYKGEKYIYFTSSAGQIRTKKCVFIKESVWNQYEKTIMCGLTLDEINNKGGINPN